ncbi:hypothetical protein [Enterococcus sp. BWR-S5]|uniref:hypothetical protein n=1 Tax=Enterococcus sp. BWR-S5 TaxID=2787714 RepID=UPI001921D719|nr:hypothetical protein [Enterococcus sp. BWR-S5]MBL1227243.1 hypothetical protein [Enterococcus sp. BWR-S5]
MFITIEKAIIDGKEIADEDIDYWKILTYLSSQIDTLKLKKSDDVIGREESEFEIDRPIKNEDDLSDYLFSNYRYWHHTKKRKAKFKIGNSTLYLRFS